MTLVFMNRNDNGVCILGTAQAKVVRSWLGDCMSCFENPWPDVARLGFRWWLPIWQFCTTPFERSLTCHLFDLPLFSWRVNPWEEDAGSTNTSRSPKLEKKPDWQHPSTNGNYYNEARRLYDFFHEMKRERWAVRLIKKYSTFDS